MSHVVEEEQVARQMFLNTHNVEEATGIVNPDNFICCRCKSPRLQRNHQRTFTIFTCDDCGGQQKVGYEIVYSFVKVLRDGESEYDSD